MKVKQYKHLKDRRATRVRAKLFGTAARPRLAVARSNKHFQAQLIDDASHKTLIGLSTTSLKPSKGQTKIDQAVELGKELAQKAAKLKIEAAILDRGPYRYHGRVKAFTDSVRENGIRI